MTDDFATVRALREDMALQLARCLRRDGATQSSVARRLDIPQPTLSKIVRGQVDDLSLELLIRIAVRLALPLAIVTGSIAEEAGVYIGKAQSSARPNASPVNDSTRLALAAAVREMSPAERLAAMARHSESLVELRAAGQATRQTAPTSAPKSAPKSAPRSGPPGAR